MRTEKAGGRDRNDNIWRTIAIIFILLFSIISGLLFWSGKIMFYKPSWDFNFLKVNCSVEVLIICSKSNQVILLNWFLCLSDFWHSFAQRPETNVMNVMRCNKLHQSNPIRAQYLDGSGPMRGLLAGWLLYLVSTLLVMFSAGSGLDLGQIAEGKFRPECSEYWKLGPVGNDARRRRKKR